jgi:hypothetical protein
MHKVGQCFNNHICCFLDSRRYFKAWDTSIYFLALFTAVRPDIHIVIINMLLYGLYMTIQKRVRFVRHLSFTVSARKLIKRLHNKKVKV